MSSTPVTDTANDNAGVVVHKKRRLQLKRGQIKWLILGAVVILVAWSLIGRATLARRTANVIPYTDTTVLQYAAIENSISATGIVESASKHYVYSSLSYPVAAVLAEVGDAVGSGDVLCELDQDELERQITEKELTMSNAQKATAQSIKVALSNYENYQAGLEQGTNSSLISAQSSVDNAYDSWQKAQDTYEQYQDSLDRGGDATLLNQRNTMNSAKASYDAAQDAYRDARDARDEAEEELEEYLDGLQSPSDESIANAESAVRAAEIAYNSAKTARDAAEAVYEEKLAAYNAEGGDTPENLDALRQAEADYLAAENAAQAAEDALKAKRQRLEDLEDSDNINTNPTVIALEKAVDTAKATLSAKVDARDAAKKSYDTAREAYQAAQRTADNTLEGYLKNVDSTERAYQTALTSQKAAEVAAEQQLESYRNSLESSQVSADNEYLLSEFQLARLYKNLEDASVKAPAAGTVTAAYAQVGASGSGLLFVIEDTADLIVETSVKSYDIGTVKEGMPVAIKSDATGDAVFAGRIRTIAPTSGKTAQGNTDTSGDAVFATKVALLAQDTGLYIGMDVRLSYIVDQQDSALAVPYEAVYENAAGETCVLGIMDQPDGKQVLQAYVVDCGMETDLEIVISGEQIAEGLRIVNDADAYAALIGQEVFLSDEGTSSSDARRSAFPFRR